MITISNKFFVFLSIFILMITGVFPVFSQKSNNVAMIKSTLTYKYVQNVEWENETSKSTYVFGVLTNDENVVKSFKSLASKLMKNKPVSVVVFTSFLEIAKTDVLFVDVDFVTGIKDILSKVKGNNTLLVSFDAMDKMNVMINMNDVSGKIHFEVNKPNILSEGMHVGSNLLILGGTELDVAKLYKESQNDLAIEKETVKNQRKNLALKEEEIRLKKIIIESQVLEITKQHEQIFEQKEEIEKQKEDILQQTINLKKLKSDVLVKQKALIDKTKELEFKVLEIKKQEVAIKLQELEMNVGREKLVAQMHQIQTIEAKIKKQKMILLVQSAKIGLLENINYLFTFILFLVVGLAFFIFRSYQIQKKGKILTEEKNKQIATFASKLESEQELTMNSIRYAKSIQEAILPHDGVMNSVIENFVIFRPKDIVAGDFYWFHHIPPIDQEPELIFVGVLDCTGHGVPGAFMSMIGTSLLNEIVKEKGIKSPAAILEQLDLGVIAALKQGSNDNNDGMDACFVMIERRVGEDNKVVFCGAKRSLIYITPDSLNINELKGDRKSIGGAIKKVRNIDFTNHELTLPKDTLLYLTTDGFIDQNAPDRSKFGLKKICETIQQNIHLSLTAQKNAFESALDLHQGKEVQRDDITFIGLKL